MTEQGLREDGWDSYPWWWIAGENLVFFGLWAIGFGVMWPLRIVGVPVASLAYAALVAITVGWLLKVHNCSTCPYYGKWCHLGWGKYAALICKQDSGNPETGAKLALVYPISSVIPVLGGIGVMMLDGFSWALLAWLIVFAALSGVQAALLRPRACAHCKRRNTCPGSAARH